MSQAIEARAGIAGRVVAPGAGESFSMMGIHLTPKVTADDVGGALSVIEQAVEPGRGSPPHICHRDHKVIYVLAGEFDIRLGDATHRTSAGGCAIIPRGVVHNFRNAGTTPGKVLVILSPGGHERFLRALSDAVADGGQPTPEQLASICDAGGVEMIRPGQG